MYNYGRLATKSHSINQSWIAIQNNQITHSRIRVKLENLQVCLSILFFNKQIDFEEYRKKVLKLTKNKARFEVERINNIVRDYYNHVRSIVKFEAD